MNAQELSLLSVRERSILDLAILGFKDKAIADKLGISKGTVGTYWTRIRRKLGPVTRAQLAAVVGRSEGSNGEVERLMFKVDEICERLEAETARRRATERYLHLLRKLVTGVARYTTTGQRAELVVGTPEMFDAIGANSLAFCTVARAVEFDGEPRDFMSFRVIQTSPGEVVVAILA